MDAIDHRTHVNEVHGGIGARARHGGCRRHVRVQLGMPAAIGSRTDSATPVCPHSRGLAAVQKAVETWEHLTGAERRKQFAARSFVELGKIDRAVALVAQNLNECGPAFFGWGLELAVKHAQEMHLQGLDLKIFCVSAVRTRK
ncbi:MAG TPA: hypothetical protein VN700_02380 [Vicinamibacterales bacterium]|nr:hypothetical protein [Vicinamibacterales bacterium]